MSQIGSSTAKRLDIDLRLFDLSASIFHALLLDEGLMFTRAEKWLTAESLDALDGEVLYEGSPTDGTNQLQRIVRRGSAIVHVDWTNLSLTVTAAAATREECSMAIKAVRETMPRTGIDDRVAIKLRWSRNGGSADVGVKMTVPEWKEVRSNYSRPTRDGLSELMAWEDLSRSAGNLILWHGPPGTGKTTAIRALAGAWRDHANFEFVTDPESFLGNAGYLLTTLAEGTKARERRWRADEPGDRP